ncbi:MAG TPA: DPP IV N-terminal domain-containing protein [Anaerolineaceae bacterium]|nr:DPP IV N-terminal domain-containing protein [Anaerolineaceae bacterium]
MRRIAAVIVLASFLASCSPQATPTPTSFPTPVDIPVDWASLHLSGKLMYIRFRDPGNQLVQLDLASGQSKVVFQTPERGVLSAAALSPDGAQIALTYSAPPPPGESFLFPTLYLLPADGSDSLKKLIPGVGKDDSYFNPSWAPDSKAIYATHYHRGSGGSDMDRDLIEKVTLDGKAAPVIDSATWPEVSPNGTKLAYLTIDPKTLLNNLAIANADGSDPRLLLPGKDFPTVDAHRFTPDGKAILFSAANPSTSSRRQTPLERLFGVEVVTAHNLPSDLYLLSLDGGNYRRITNANGTGLYPAISPDGRMLAFISQNGIYVCKMDGSGVVQISSQLVIGTLDWTR